MDVWGLEAWTYWDLEADILGSRDTDVWNLEAWMYTVLGSERTETRHTHPWPFVPLSPFYLVMDRSRYRFLAPRPSQIRKWLCDNHGYRRETWIKLLRSIFITIHWLPKQSTLMTMWDHTGYKQRQFLQQNAIMSLFAAKYPKINLLKHVWDILDRKIQTLHPPIANLEGLHNLSPDFIWHLAECISTIRVIFSTTQKCLAHPAGP